VIARSTSIDVSYRNIGAILGALLGLVAIAILVALSSVPEIESVLLIRQVLSGSGAFPEGSIQPAMLAVPPLSAAMGGWLLAVRAIAGDRWSGAVMGATTYFVANLIGPIVAYGSAMEMSLFEVIAGAPLIAIFASFLLFPILLVCFAAGTAWAAILRLTARIPEAAAQSLPSRPFSGLLIAMGTGVLALGWVPLAMTLGGLLSGGPWVD
jgi:hypothetical protein